MINKLKRFFTINYEGIASARIINKYDNLSMSNQNTNIDKELNENGFVNLGNCGFSVDVISEKVKYIFDSKDNSESSIIAIKHPFLIDKDISKFLSIDKVNETIINYLGNDATFDRMWCYRVTTESSKSDVSGLWHHDRVGKRIKMFVLLHDIDESRRPLVYAKGSQKYKLTNNSYSKSRGNTDEMEKKFNNNITKLIGKKGDLVLIDTHGWHRASWEEGLYFRDVLSFEWSSYSKSVQLEKFNLPIGIKKELFFSEFNPENTLMKLGKLEVNGKYKIYGSKKNVLPVNTIDAIDFL